MKLTVNFGKTAVVVPCKEEWTVSDLIRQATQRYRKTLEQGGDFLVQTHHMTHLDGGILDPDDLLADLVEDKDKLIAVYEECEALDPVGVGATGRPSPETCDSELPGSQPVGGGEIEVNSPILKSNSALPVRIISDPGTETEEPTASVQVKRDWAEGRGMWRKYLLLSQVSNHVPGGATEGRGTNMSQVTPSALTRTVEISGDHRPLGIHLVPYCSSLSGRVLGLRVRGVEENSRSHREGMFQEDECIVKINETELTDKPFARSQEVFRRAMDSPMVHLEVLSANNKARYEKNLISQLLIPEENTGVIRVKVPRVLQRIDSPDSTITLAAHPPEVNSAHVSRRGPQVTPRTIPLSPSPEVNSAHVSRRGPQVTPRTIPLSPSPEVNSAHVSRCGPQVTPRTIPLSPSPEVNSTQVSRRGPQVNPPTPPAEGNGKSRSPVAGFSNAKGGRTINIDLTKGLEGLGFTVVTRAESGPGHGPGQILVKQILPQGAAVQDGRLQSGDRILRVNGVDITAGTQEQLVTMLRATKRGEVVSLLVDRPEEMCLIQEVKGEQACTPLLNEGKEQLMFEIPLSEGPGSTGLGLNLRGTRSLETGADLGIFIKSIIHGGAAQKDGRLCANDQLIAVNGESLLGLSNHDGMETLHHSMSADGNRRGTIQLVVLRALGRPRQENHDTMTPQDGQTLNTGEPDHQVSPPSVHDRANERSEAPDMLPNGNTDGMDQDRSLPHPPGPWQDVSCGPLGGETNPFRGRTLPSDRQHNYVQSSKSMDLDLPVSPVARELGVKKSRSLESLRTAAMETRRRELGFHRRWAGVARGRGCNQSFRAAIDRSYSDLLQPDDGFLTDNSDQSSDCEPTPGAWSRRALGDVEEGMRVPKKAVKARKEKGKGKAQTVNSEEKTKRKGFRLFRFGKKKEEKGEVQSDAAPISEERRSEVLSDEELRKMKEERERIEGKHKELQVRDHFLQQALEDSSSRRQAPPYRNRLGSPQRPPPSTSHSRNPSREDNIDRMYAKVNKHRPPTIANKHRPPTIANSDPGRIQQLRMEYRQTRQGGAAPAYEELENWRRFWAGRSSLPRPPERGLDGRPSVHFEGVQHPYASLPRHGQVDSRSYPSPPQGRYREPPSYYTHPRYLNQLPWGSPRQGNPRFYPPPSPQQQMSPFRQDAPRPLAPHLGPPHYDKLGHERPPTKSTERRPHRQEPYQEPLQNTSV